MGNKKRSRREAETNAELETALVAKSEAEVLENRKDDELFIVDRSGSKWTETGAVQKWTQVIHQKSKSKTKE